jgi:hypothetical protein
MAFNTGSAEAEGRAPESESLLDGTGAWRRCYLGTGKMRALLPPGAICRTDSTTETIAVRFHLPFCVCPHRTLPATVAWAPQTITLRNEASCWCVSKRCGAAVGCEKLFTVFASVGMLMGKGPRTGHRLPISHSLHMLQG